MRQISTTEAKTKLTELLAEVERGGAVEITRRGKPVARLMPVERAGAVPRREAVEHMRTFMKRQPQQRFSVEEILEMRDEGRRF